MPLWFTVSDAQKYAPIDCKGERKHPAESGLRMIKRSRIMPSDRLGVGENAR